MAIDVTKKKGRRSGAGAPGGGAKRGSYDRRLGITRQFTGLGSPVGGERKVSDQEKRELIMDIKDVSENTVAGLHGENLDKAWRKALIDAEKPRMKMQPATTTRQNKGGLSKKPKFMKGGSYKGKSHMYAAGGMVKELKI